MTFPCNKESCIKENNLYFKFYSADSVKNITAIKSLDLLSKEFVFKNISFYKSCKCGCLLFIR